MTNNTLEWIKVVGSLLFSWPVAAVLIALLFRKAVLRLIQRLVDASEGKAEVGPVKFELGKLARDGQSVVQNLQRLSVLMAESRLLELEITQGKFGGFLTPEQQERMNAQIEELRRLTASSERGS